MSKFEPGAQCQYCGELAPIANLRFYTMVFNKEDLFHQKLTNDMPKKIKKILRHGIDKIGFEAHAEGFGCQS